MKIDNLHWRCFLALEDDLLATSNFVEFHKSNEGVFSIKFRSIILQTCSEIEKFLKLICGIPLEDNSNIDKYKEYFSKHHADFNKIEVLMPTYRGIVMPWEKWQENINPDFWIDHNTIKHQGNLELATLKNAIDSVAGLFSVLLAWYFKTAGEQFPADQSIIQPKLFSYEGLDAQHVVTYKSYRISIPGFLQQAPASANAVS